MKQRPSEAAPQGSRWRSALVLGLVVLGAVGLAARAVELQLLDHGFLAKQGDDRSMRVVKIAAHRGAITDRSGEPLAVSTPVDSVWVNPQELNDNIDQLPKLAKALKQDQQSLARRITSNLDREFLYLVRHMPPEQAAHIKALGIPGVYLLREYRRYYPAGEVAGHIVGFTTVDDQGQEGLELGYDQLLNGEDGAKRVIQDLYGRYVENVESIRAPRPGRDLVTSIDLRIQYLAYRELKAAMQEYRAHAGSVIVIDIDTGEVLAMVNQPSYNPNDREQLKAEPVPQPRGDRHLRARLEHQAVHHGRRACLRAVPSRQRGGHLARVLHGRQQDVRGGRAESRRHRFGDDPRQVQQRRHRQGRAVAEARTDLEHPHEFRTGPGHGQRLSG